jgi:uncharacterized protein YutE (UPF0331/DUF86 family)
MTPEVLARKLARLREFLDDLSPHAGKSVGEVMEDRYEIERLLELLVQVSVDMVGHDLAGRDVVPGSYREAFLEAGRQEILPMELSERLADAAGLRNVLVHLYDTIDYQIVAASIGRALTDFGHLSDIYAARLE